MAAASVMLALATSCEREAVDDSFSVKLYASMGKVPTKGNASDDSGVRDYDYSGTLDISLVRIDEGKTGYPDFISTASSPIAAELGTPDGSYRRSIRFGTAQFYSNETNRIRFASWYPATGQYSTSATASTVTFNVDGKTDILYGSVVEGSKSTGFEDIAFNHALCQYNIYAYKMNTSDDGDVADGDIDWGALTDIVIEKVQKHLVLTLPKSPEYEYGIESPESQEELASLNLATTEGIKWNLEHPDDTSIPIPTGFDSKKHIATYLAPPPVGGFITMGVRTTTQTPYHQISIARNFQPGCAYDIVLRFSSHGIINAEVSVGRWNYYSPLGGEKVVHDVNAEMYYDLSAYTTANCYIVPAGNYGYSFVGNVKGKSTEPLTSNMEDPGYIDVLWCDNTNIWDESKNPALDYGSGGNYFQLVGHTLSKNRIMFKLGNPQLSEKKLPDSMKGNIVIAAYRDNTKSEILWTWHLWLNGSVSSVGLTNGYLALNHNVGASSPGSPGLYYQWGRKDPFAIGHFSTSTDTVTPAESAQHPNVFYGKGQNNWFSGSVSDFLNSSFTSDNLDVSSIYDPCPAGYSVPDSRMWSTASIAHYQTEYVTGDHVSLGVQGTVVKFPLSQGYLDENGTKETDKPLFIWSISTNKAGTEPMVFLYPESGNSPAASVDHTNYGGAIRCISKGPATYKNLSEAQTANSYIISEDGYYKFKANVAGNGVSSLITDAGTEWNITGSGWGTKEAVKPNFTPERIDYLWYQPALDVAVPESISTADVCVRILNDGAVDKDGYVYLEVENWKAGNLVLAAYSGNTILWSWHLWLTAKPEDKREGNDYYTIMDRNLGATRAGDAFVDNTNALAVYGLYYQWGRKDPSPGPQNASSAGSAFDSSPWFRYDRAGHSWSRNSRIDHLHGPVSTKVAAENPDKFIEVDSQTGDKYHWMSGYNDSDYHKSLWGYAIAGKSWGIKPFKTMYDPCPPGYMVAHHWVFWMHDKHYDNNPGFGSLPSDFTAAGSFGYTSKVFGGGYVPLTGHRIYSGLCEDQGTKGYLWGSTPKSGGRTVTIGGYWPGLYNNKAKEDQPNRADNGFDQAYGQSVRCLKQ